MATGVDPHCQASPTLELPELLLTTKGRISLMTHLLSFSLSLSTFPDFHNSFPESFLPQPRSQASIVAQFLVADFPPR